jgi:quinone-modifying oxidoreductase, subunit QmoA
VSGGNGKVVLVLGGGIAGMTAAIEAAEAGCEVVLVEKAPYLGGRVARMNQYFPKLCPPACGLEINYRRIRSNPGITVLTLAELEKLSGSPGDYEAVVRLSPRFVSEQCTACGDCARVCPAERADEFNYGLSKTKAAYLPHNSAFPAEYVIERSACSPSCSACVEACKYGAVDLGQQTECRTFRVAAVIAATGWSPYDATKLNNLGYGKCANVVTNVLMERLSAPGGPTGGRIVRPSDGKPPVEVGFVQCAGSRDENHLPYCSSVCCSASLKQATYVRSQYPEAHITVFYIDIRTPGRLEEFYKKVADEGKIEFIKGKAAKVEEDPATGDVVVTAEDALSGKRVTRRVSLLVLATGVVPQTEGLPQGFALDESRFIFNNPEKTGLYGAGCARRPEEVSASIQDATGAALKALQCVTRSARHG